MRIAILGSRGIPARYGGFETFAEELAAALASAGHEVSVFCEGRGGPAAHRGARLVHVDVPRLGPLTALLYDARSLWTARRGYDVVFTNPLCREYRFDAPVMSADGSTMLEGKPRNVYCTKSSDWAGSASRPTSAQSRLVAWVDALGEGDEVFFAFLSFSNTAVKDALCGAAMRGARVTFLLDAETPSSTAIRACGATVETRGHQGGIGYAHNKIVQIFEEGGIM